MAIVKPFAALRPAPALAAQICQPPYDVLSSEEARAMARGNPLSFLHVSKPEIDLPDGTDLYSPAVYATGRRNFEKLMRLGVLKQDQRPCFYLYRQIMGAHAQTGWVAVASCAEYLEGVIRKHELTRPDKEDDRARHIEVLNSQTGPVFLVYRAERALDEWARKFTQAPAEIDFQAPDGVRHSSWTVPGGSSTEAVEACFASIQNLYIADGHHRCAAAARVFRARNGAGSSGFFLAVIFPHDQVQILPYHRVIKDLNGLTPGQALEKLGAVCEVVATGKSNPQGRREMALYLAGQWYTLRFRSMAASGNLAEDLDVSRLQQHLLSPIFGINDPRTSARLGFVGGLRGSGELERLVNSGEYACAFSMFPTGIEELMTIADAGGIMAPKSTWFEPKLRDAMFCHLLE